VLNVHFDILKICDAKLLVFLDNLPPLLVTVNEVHAKAGRRRYNAFKHCLLLLLVSWKSRH
jgi:hypothetical protein